MNLEPNQPPTTTTTLLLSTCNLHPDEQHPGFCASCLRERLAGLESSSISTATTSHRKITTSALKSIFRTSTNNKPSSSSSSFLPELRRCKSFSGRKAEGFSGAFEPQRKSCDVRARNTLWYLFNNERKVVVVGKNKEICEEEEETIPGLLRVVGDPIPTRDEVEEEEEEEEGRNGEEIRVSNVNVNVSEVIEEEEEVITMKDHIDHDSHNTNNNNKKPSGRDLKDIAGSFWVAASVFSKKLQKWRRKQKMKKSGTGTSSLSRMHNKPQSEIADYGYGRRSCDVDPRYSLDAPGRMSLDAPGRMSLDAPGRMSFDDPRYSWDEPRASWDGYLIGRTFPRLAPMVSVVEDLPPPPPPPPPVIIMRSDNQIPVEEPLNSSSNDDTTPGGSAQTRDYYSDSSQRRRKSFERSNSIRKKAAADVVEDNETKPVSNAKVSPAATIDQLPGPKLIGTDRDLRDSKSNSLRDDRSESFESAFRDSAASVSGGLDQKGLKKSSSSRWSKAWNIWGLIHKRNVGGGGKEDEEERYNRGNVVERSYSESWQDLRRDVNVEAAKGGGGGGFNRVFRSNSSVSSRHSFNTTTPGQFGSMRSSNAETNGQAKKRKEEVVLERSRSARYSPNDVDNGLLRFYLTPLRNRRNGSVKNNSKPPKNTYSIARSVLRLY